MFDIAAIFNKGLDICYLDEDFWGSADAFECSLNLEIS